MSLNKTNMVPIFELVDWGTNKNLSIDCIKQDKKVMRFEVGQIFIFLAKLNGRVELDFSWNLDLKFLTLFIIPYS